MIYFIYGKTGTGKSEQIYASLERAAKENASSTQYFDADSSFFRKEV